MRGSFHIFPDENNTGFNFVGGPYPNTNVYKDTHRKTSMARVLATWSLWRITKRKTTYKRNTTMALLLNNKMGD